MTRHFSHNNPQKRGSELSLTDKQRVLCQFVNRHTMEHVPAWAKETWRDGKPYPPQYRTDAEWLERTFFNVRKDGTLSDNSISCYSTDPTYPLNPELRQT
jgi:hypothetical protein